MEAFAARPCKHARQAVWSEQILSRHALKAIAQGANHAAGDPNTAVCCMTCGARSSPWAKAEQRRCGHQLALDMQRLELYCLVCGDYQFCQDFDQVLTAARVRLQPQGRAQQLTVAANDPAANVIVTRQRAASHSRGNTPSAAAAAAAPAQAPAAAPPPAAAATARATRGGGSAGAAWGSSGGGLVQQQAVPGDNHPQGLRGLNNLGHTCFMNCVLQVLFHAPLLRHFYLGEGHHPAACRAAAKDRPCLSCQMDSIFADMYSGSRSPLSPTEFLYQWWRYAEPMANYDQQDAHEFYLSLLEGLAGSRITPPGGSSSSNDGGGQAAAAAAAAGGGGGAGSAQQPSQAGRVNSRPQGVAAEPSSPAAAAGGGRVDGQSAAGALSPPRHLWHHTQQQPPAAAAWPSAPSGLPSHPQLQQAGGSHSSYLQATVPTQQQQQQQPPAAAPVAVNGLLPNGMRPAIPLQLHVAGCSTLGSSGALPLTGVTAGGGVGGAGAGAGRATTPEVVMVGTGEGGASQPSPSPEPVGASLVDTALQGLLQSDVVCRECGHTSSTFDPFRDISLDLHVPRAPRYPPRLGAHPLGAAGGPPGSTPEARLTPTEGFTPSPTPPPSELRLGPAAVEEGPEGLMGATPAVSSSSGPSREGCSEWVSAVATSEGGARRSELASAAWTPELAGKSCASQSSGLAGLATSQASQPGGVVGDGGEDPHTRANTPGLSDARGGGCLEGQGEQGEVVEEGDGAERPAAGASAGREYTPSSYLVEDSSAPAAGLFEGAAPLHQHRPQQRHGPQQQVEAEGSAAAEVPAVTPPPGSAPASTASTAEGGTLRTLSGSLSALLKPATEVLQQLLSPARSGAGPEGQGAPSATHLPTQQQQQGEGQGMAAVGGGEGAGRGAKRHASDGGDASTAAQEPAAKMLRRRSQDGIAADPNALAAQQQQQQQQQQVGVLAGAPPVATAGTAAGAAMPRGLQQQQQQQYVDSRAAAAPAPGAMGGTQYPPPAPAAGAAPAAPSGKAGKGGRKAGGGGAPKPPKAPRVQRCGQCHTCLHRHLKKGCMRNRELKDATAEGVDGGGPQLSAPGALEHLGTGGAAAGAGGWRASSAPAAGEHSGILGSTTATPQPSAVVAAELAGGAGVRSGGLTPAAAPAGAARAAAGGGGGRGHSPAMKKEATLKLAAAMRREQRVMAAVEPASLLGCLHRFVRPEQLSHPSSWRCECCSVVGQGTKQLSFRRLPPVLCFHIKRFEHGGPGLMGGGGRARKLDVPLRFPVGELDMRPFLSSCLYQQRWGLRCSAAAAAAPDGQACGTSEAAGGVDPGMQAEPQEHQQQQQQQQQQAVKQGPGLPQQQPEGGGGQAGSGEGASSSTSSSSSGRDFLYHLFGVVSHRGDMQGGHYVSYVRCGGSWYLCDDASIYPADEAEVAACQAYMLFYASSRYWAADRGVEDPGLAAGALAAAVAQAVAGAAIKQEG